MHSETGRRSIWENGQLRVFVGGERDYTAGFIQENVRQKEKEKKRGSRLRAFLVSGSPSEQNLSAGGVEVQSIVQSGPLGGVWPGCCRDAACSQACLASLSAGLSHWGRGVWKLTSSHQHHWAQGPSGREGSSNSAPYPRDHNRAEKVSTCTHSYR